jgi:subtilase family serine protease
MPVITTTSTTTTTTPTGPDLAPIGWMSPPSAVAGGNLAVQFTVKNNGPGAAVAPWYDYVLFSNDLALGNDTAIGTPQHTMNLAAGGQYVSSPQVTIPAVAPGNYYLFLHTDGSNAVAENNEPNNIGGFVLVQVIAPDLAPTAFTGPASGAGADRSRCRGR